MADLKQTTSAPSTAWDDREHRKGFVFGYPLKFDNLRTIAAKRPSTSQDIPSDCQESSESPGLATGRVISHYHDAASRAVGKESAMELVYAPISGRTHYLLGFPFQLYPDEIVKFKDALDGLKIGKLGWYTISPRGTFFPNACTFSVLKLQ